MIGRSSLRAINSLFSTAEFMQCNRLMIPSSSSIMTRFTCNPIVSSSSSCLYSRIQPFASANRSRSNDNDNNAPNASMNKISHDIGEGSFTEQEIKAFADHFVGCIMRDGAKDRTIRLYTNILKQLQSKLPSSSDPRVTLMTAVDIASPLVKNKKSFRGRRMIQIPNPLNDKQRHRHAIMWIRDIVESKKKDERDGMAGASIYAKEIMKILDGSSSVLAKRDALHKACLAQKSNIRMNTTPVAFRF